MDITSVFQGLTTPLPVLHEQIAALGWEVTKVKWDNKLSAFVAEAKNVHGEKVQKTGPTDKTALGNILIAVARHTHMRTAAQWKVSMWKDHFVDQAPAIAEAYAKAANYEHKAAAAWKALGDDSLRRTEALARQIHIEHTDDPEPYANAKEMTDDVQGKQHLFVSRANSDHPLWSHEQHMAFRAAHDVLGHVVSGGGHDWHGINQAAAAHFPLLSPEAQQALFGETIAPAAYAQHYKALGPHKIALFPEFYEPAQKTENAPGHWGIHPSQSVAPVEIPQYKRSKLGAVQGDPNAGWSSGIDPLEVNIHGVGNAYLDHGDPLQSQQVMQTAAMIDTKWHDMKMGNGEPDVARMKQAIVNAFRVVLLSPRKDLRWNAVHYQDISHVPSEVDDPKVYWDALEQHRRSWNKAQGIDENAHMVYFKFIRPFQSVIHQMHPELGFDGAKKKADEILFDWRAEEQQRIEAEDADKPSDSQRGADEIERRANEALAKRMQLFLKDKTNPKTDVEHRDTEHLQLFSGMGDQYNLLTGEPALKYGAFMGTHLKAIAQISQHVDEIMKAALEDVHGHDATGHHFRAAVLRLGISGVGPKVCSFAWLLLQPMTSQLATIDTHMVDVLGHNYEKEMNNRDYFKFERELSAGRDAAGYQHIPLGAFQWGMWDHKRTGPGTHQDHSAMRVLDPTPHNDIDWQAKQDPIGVGAQDYKASWATSAPDWWRNTEGARKAVGEDWNQNIAPQYPKSQIPYQVLGDPTLAARYAKAGESVDEFHVALAIPENTVKQLAELANELDLDDPDDPTDYHITAFWSEHGYEDKSNHDWVRKNNVNGFRFENARIEHFPSADNKVAVVVRFDSPEAKEQMTRMMDEADERGLEIKRFDGGWKGHITLGFQKDRVTERKVPEINFRAGDLYVSIPRPLRTAAAATSVPYLETKMQSFRREYPHLTTPEIWSLFGDHANSARPAAKS